MKMKKKLLLVLMVVLGMLALSACGSEKKAETSAQSEVEQLVVSTSPDFPPFEFLAENQDVIGIEMDILNLICEKLDKQLIIRQVDFNSILPGVQSGAYDVGVSGISITEERKKNVLFTDPYCLAAQKIVVLNGSTITSKADLEGKKVSVQTGTTAEDFCVANGYVVDSYQANNDAEAALIAGKVDAWVIDDLNAANMVKEYDALNPEALVILDEAMTTEPYAFAMALGNEEKIEEINAILKELVADGTVAQIFEKYEAPYTAPTVE